MPPVHGGDKERRRGVGRVGPVTQGSVGEVVKQYLTAISTNTRQVVHSPLSRESIIMHSKSELVQRICTALST